MIPVVDFEIGEHFKVISGEQGEVVLFKPHEWRGAGSCKPVWNCLTLEEMAAEINGYTKGTVGHLYLTSDGGFSISDLFDLVSLLDDHVEILDHERLADMALQSVASLS